MLLLLGSVVWFWVGDGEIPEAFICGVDCLLTVIAEAGALPIAVKGEAEDMDDAEADIVRRGGSLGVEGEGVLAAATAANFFSHNPVAPETNLLLITGVVGVMLDGSSEFKTLSFVVFVLVLEKGLPELFLIGETDADEPLTLSPGLSCPCLNEEVM